MKWGLGLSRARTGGGFTLAEAVIAVGVVSIITAACLASIVFSRVTATKAKEQAIAMDFLVHYAEMIRALPYREVSAGNAINPLLNGELGAPNIRIPTDDSWVQLDTDHYETFHPDLMWIHHRNPKLRVALTTENVRGESHTKHLNICVEWDAPLKRGKRLRQQTDLIRVKDL